MILQLALAVLLGTQAGAQDSPGDAALDSLIRETFSNVERFKLFNECRPMVLWPIDVDTESGLTKDRIQALVESRLRAARLYLDHEAPNYPAVVEQNRPLAYLGVSVKATKNAFSVAVNYNKRVYDPVSDVSATTKTSTESIFGTHFGDGDFVLQGLSEQIDKFVLEYLRVNEAACK